ncbi:helix-turn-helix domain-containing protein [Pelagerythrobacter marinus]|uniref:helix-turn-helix domain-containing protein n=1 Tax=Pelagerythrobacter marinus TaxID=538382 RepID=UPI0020371088|nr:helix-turn-helix domain-containing protein [Pelagerythrobacter marinus]USA38704.1 helix-turn-helix domain-containing protein [Pelagerythrobacter marinus]WPZ07269.1 helix-turn-helix domain-containing protein [Pelagerythrobacter marinus]
MDSQIAAAARSLGEGDPLSALKRVSLRDDPPALALRGMGMAQLGDLARARALLRKAGRAFGSREAVAQARCAVAEAEIALVSRDLAGPADRLARARATLESRGDTRNAAHAGALAARRLLLIGRIGQAEQAIDGVDPGCLPAVSRVGYWLVRAGIAMRRIRAAPAREALDEADRIARHLAIPALQAEVDRARDAFGQPAACRIARDRRHPLALAEVEALFGSGAVVVVDACRHAVRGGATVVPLASRPVLFALVRALAEAWPADVSREDLLLRACRARHADESHRARLRVEVGRLRRALGDLADVRATARGFALAPRGGREPVVLAPLREHRHGDVLALLADGEAWSSSALALALGVSARTVQRALERLAHDGEAEPFGRGRGRRWVIRKAPGFPTGLLLPGSLGLG